jgi:hypothetical protein
MMVALVVAALLVAGFAVYAVGTVDAARNPAMALSTARVATVAGIALWILVIVLAMRATG